MAERICEVCGATNDPAARFCRVCDSYLGWDSGGATLDGEPLTGTVPTVVDSVATEQSLETDAAPPAAAPADAEAQHDIGAEASDAAATPAQPEASAHHAPAEAPVVALETTDALVAPDAPATVVLRLTNPSAIVDGYRIEPVAGPAWLAFTHDDTHLMPGQEALVPLTLALRDDVLVFAQRVSLTVRVASLADPALTADAVLQLTVPPLGPSAALEVRPSLIRLEDAGAGEFTVRLDNRAANFPQTVRLTATDVEEVVRFAFAPSVVSVPPGQVVEVVVAFSAPAPAPGQELTRQVTVEAGNDAGRAAAPLTIVQRTAPEPVDAPVRVRIEPSTLVLDRGNIGEFDVVIDHRGSHKPITLAIAGRDPAHVIGFAFSSTRLVVEPDTIGRVRGRLSAPQPPRGETARHPFTVVASDDVQDVEAAGTVELSSPPDPILTANITVDPPAQLVVNERQTAFAVAVDNRRGVDPLGVRLEGVSEDGAARLTFTPPELVVPPGTVGSARVVVDAPQPEPRQTAVRKLHVSATDGVQRIETVATFTQARADRRPIASRVLVIVGGMLVIIGALAEWFAGFPPFLPSAGLIGDVVRFGVGPGDIGLTEPATRVLLLLFAALMLLGMIGRSGRLTRAAAILVVLLTVGWLIFLAVVAVVPPLGIGLFLVWIGAVLGFAGGVLARPRTP
ncbi:hypothetical protein [Agromyces larvae]|uniref:Zinc ribbon domain-containing protein n=1 Tax=Agromyces larvae TaxID=2929802 RepID=A0ABY4BUJ7_9MICO|nr:hypothetical protein [Agromyces larvae]UOE42877.1 hypothetical protein MTO99_11835 [Agromyces larvae]